MISERLRDARLDEWSDTAEKLREAADVIDALVAATPDLSCTISWLENGCDPLMAAKELRIYRERIDAALAMARRK